MFQRFRGRPERYERAAEEFEKHRWRKGFIYAPIIAAAIFIGGGLGSGNVASGWKSGVAALVAWPFVYRFWLGPHYQRAAGLRDPQE